MNKKIMILGASTAILLAACGGGGGKDIKGSELYADGKYESYVEAYKYFSNVLKKEPGNNEAEEHIKIITKEFIELSKKLIEEKYTALEPIEAEKYLNGALELAPDDEELLDVKDMITKAAEDQRSINKFTDYMEETYKTFNTNYVTFSDILAKANTGVGNQAEVMKHINEEYPKIVELRKNVDKESFGYVTNGYTQLADINTNVFNYLLNVEREFNTIINKSKNPNGYTLEELNGDLLNYNASSVNAVFLQVQKDFTSFIEQVDSDGNRKYNVKNTLNFSQSNDDGDDVIVEEKDESNESDEK